jgi:hypothetical protein
MKTAFVMLLLLASLSLAALIEALSQYSLWIPMRLGDQTYRVWGDESFEESVQRTLQESSHCEKAGAGCVPDTIEPPMRGDKNGCACYKDRDCKNPDSGFEGTGCKSACCRTKCECCSI